jgi:DsbC/DsbD-like thiol-disulfide interchange protein
MLPLLMIALSILAQPKPLETAHLWMSTSVTATKDGGRRLALHVDVTPKPSMHVYAPGQPGYIAIELKLDADAPVKAAGKPKYPAGEKLFMPALDETQLVYGKPFRITQDVTLRPGAQSGPVTIKGSVRYQACDDRICYKPATVAVTWTLAGAI